MGCGLSCNKNKIVNLIEEPKERANFASPQVLETQVASINPKIIISNKKEVIFSDSSNDQSGSIPNSSKDSKEGPPNNFPSSQVSPLPKHRSERNLKQVLGSNSSRNPVTFNKNSRKNPFLVSPMAVLSKQKSDPADIQRLAFSMRNKLESSYESKKSPCFADMGKRTKSFDKPIKPFETP